MGQCRCALVAPRAEDLRQGFAVGQLRTGEQFRLYLLGFELVRADFHDQRLGVGVRADHGGRQRIVRRPQYVYRAQEVDGIVLAVQFPQRMQRGVGAHHRA